MRALLYVQHLLGTGHLKRTALIAKKLQIAGVDVHLVTGGVPVPVIDTADLTVHQLEPVRAADASFSSLVDAVGKPVTSDLMHRRTNDLVSIAQNVVPDMVLLETWPFGRRQLRHELLELCSTLHHQSPRPLMVCSIRDILQRGRKPERVRETVEHVERWLDHVLVHADPKFITLDQSFERTADIESKVVYTGFVSEMDTGLMSWRGDASGEVLVSAGGGAAGQNLYQLCCEAARLTGDSIRWRILVGHGLDDAAFASLREAAPPSVIIEPVRRDFPALLAQCGLSISQAGYNTTMDLVSCRCPAIVVPFDDDGETEQLDRARRLEELGLAESLRIQGLSPERLAQVIKTRIGLTAPDAQGFRVDGAAWTAKWLCEQAKRAAIAAKAGP